MEEERRLFYVGATRAKRKLCLSTAATRYRFGEVMSVPSRFISEITEDLIEKHELRHGRYWEAGETMERPRSHGTRPRGAATGEVEYEWEPDEILRVGRMVQHPTLGRGKIIRAEGFGESLKLEIMFSGLGVKKIMAKYAKLKVVG